MKKYFIVLRDTETNEIVLKMTSDNAGALIRRYNRRVYDDGGSMFAVYYFAALSTNIPEEIW